MGLVGWHSTTYYGLLRSYDNTPRTLDFIWVYAHNKYCGRLLQWTFFNIKEEGWSCRLGIVQDLGAKVLGQGEAWASAGVLIDREPFMAKAGLGALAADGAVGFTLEDLVRLAL